MTRNDIIRMAREADIIDFRDADDDPHTAQMVEFLERFAALVAASEEKWKQAVIDELICCHIYNASHDNDPRKALHDAISWNVQVALDPDVSEDALALIGRGAAAAREADQRAFWEACRPHGKAGEVIYTTYKHIRTRNNE